ncbi:hypothetical protein [Pseudarthrobacter raffinosi]|uniref:hypothetical protein n=1 Tax=Pseudarthrobacter raffinosi TaxID=2953651 RepID=UPI00208F498D|nr:MULTISPECIES: hypothetical protein [unclassified Pseudarthrobacter]MCO4237635.1 hypothetical protein [Pseudarthrobacter sp. MDT3-28]MCO4252224.1 hypothetical protein [Pseudarthrobacter sp. MDT3-9]MCO4264331.1 hypothetical protein [Pseudarthrobacter sp. MDT3-26]
MMRNLIPKGTLRKMLLPPTYGLHLARGAEFTVLSVEVWSSCLVVNIHVESAAGRAIPEIAIEDHWGTQYTFRDSASVGSRNLQVFTPSVPPGTRSLTIRSTDNDADARLVVTFAVPRMQEADQAAKAPVSRPVRLRRPA